MIKAVGLLCIITFIIYSIETLSYSLRLVTWKNRQYSLTLSTFNVISLASKFALMFQAPLLGIVVDVSINNKFDPLDYFRLIILSATLGVLIAIIFLPSFLNIFEK